MKWGDRLSTAKSRMNRHYPRWKENIEIFSGEKKFRRNRKYTYYVPILDSAYTNDRAQVIPSDIEYTAEIVGQNDMQTNAMLSSMLNSQISGIGPTDLLEYLYTFTVTKGFGCAVLDVKKLVSKTTTLKIKDTGNDEEDQKGTVKYEVARDQIDARWVPNEYVLWDPNAKYMADARWIAVMFQQTEDEFEADKDWDSSLKKLVLKENGYGDDKFISGVPLVPGGIPANMDVLPSGMPDPPPDSRFGRIGIWEVWDMSPVVFTS